MLVIGRWERARQRRTAEDVNTEKMAVFLTDIDIIISEAAWIQMLKLHWTRPDDAGYFVYARMPCSPTSPSSGELHASKVSLRTWRRLTGIIITLRTLRARSVSCWYHAAGLDAVSKIANVKQIVDKNKSIEAISPTPKFHKVAGEPFLCISFASSAHWAGQNRAS